MRGLGKVALPGAGALALAVTLAGCVAVVDESTQVAARAATGPLGIGRVQIAAFAGPGELSPEVVDGLIEGDVVLLDVSVPPDAVSVRAAGQADYSGGLGECAFGPVDGVGEASVRTGSNHLLLVVRPGTPERHAANGISCEYRPGAGGEALDASVRVRGCYLVSEVSIPTARMLVLNPLEAQACGGL